ncbi:hypothetical protein [Spongiimicrobium salis]|uniref:hypothetical protein n=1 Tax=Spongiimicrobium salis TaxID=1667022 RepID=UPI00374D9D87
MEIKFFADVSALDHLPLETQFQKVKESGYDGIQINMDKTIEGTSFQELLQAFELGCIAQIQTSGKDVGEHLNSLREQFEQSAELKPLLINALTGKDYFSFGENVQLLNEAMSLERKHGVQITHEMHRGHFSFAAHMMERYLSLLPDLKIAANFSEWCAVAGSYLEDQQEAVSVAIKRSYHIKGKWHVVAPTPSEKESKEVRKYADEKFLYWWHRIIQYQDHKIPVLPITVPFKAKFLIGNSDLKMILGARDTLLS